MSKSINKTWLVIFGLIVLVLLIIRWPALLTRAPHIDEGMGIRASEMVLSGEWQYWQKNGHGPTLFYFGALVREWWGVDWLAFRLLTTLFLLLAIFILAWAYWQELGPPGLLVLLLGFGLSPGMIFFGAYFIHESLFILLTVLAVVCFERWLLTRFDYWLALGVIFAALMYMTKETALFTYFAWVAAGAFVLWRAGKLRAVKDFLKCLPYKSLVLGLAFGGIFYLLFFGLKIDLFTAPFYWLTERGLSYHVKPWYYFGGLLLVHEFLLLVLATVAAAVLTWRRAWSPRLTFMFVWLGVITVAYSAVPYKTPWLILNLILPLGLFVALSARAVLVEDFLRRKLLMLGLVVLLILSGGRLYVDNFILQNEVSDFSYAYLQSDKNLTAIFGWLDNLNARHLRETGKPLPMQILGRGDELLHVLTEKYDRSYPPFIKDLPVYVNYQQDINNAYSLLGQDGAKYRRINFQYFEPGPSIDFLIKESLLP